MKTKKIKYEKTQKSKTTIILLFCQFLATFKGFIENLTSLDTLYCLILIGLIVKYMLAIGSSELSFKPEIFLQKPDEFKNRVLSLKIINTSYHKQPCET